MVGKKTMTKPPPPSPSVYIDTYTFTAVWLTLFTKHNISIDSVCFSAFILLCCVVCVFLLLLLLLSLNKHHHNVMPPTSLNTYLKYNLIINPHHNLYYYDLHLPWPSWKSSSYHLLVIFGAFRRCPTILLPSHVHSSAFHSCHSLLLLLRLLLLLPLHCVHSSCVYASSHCYHSDPVRPPSVQSPAPSSHPAD